MATVTAGDMVRDALGLLLVLGQQDTLAAADMDDGLRFLNSMLESWGLSDRTFSRSTRRRLRANGWRSNVHHRQRW